MRQESQKKQRRLGVLIGGSGLIGGTLAHYFKSKTPEEFDIRAPSSKKLSIRTSQDIILYLQRVKPDFVINAAMASLDSDAQLAFETNYLGNVNLARACAALKIPYLYLSSAAVLPHGKNLVEEDRLPLKPNMTNYAKSKIMAETTLEYMGETQGLDYTVIRVGIVYGEHDHKIQGFHRLLFTIADESMPFLFTKRKVKHSHTNANKLPYFVHHILNHREEFSRQTYHFVDKEPVAFDDLVLTIRAYLELKKPREIYVPYYCVRIGAFCLERLARFLGWFGISARLPPEYMFLKDLYCSQTLSREKLDQSSFVDPEPEENIYTRLPSLIVYYLTRWGHLNLITRFKNEFFADTLEDDFLYHPQELLRSVHADSIAPFPELVEEGGENEESSYATN
ncbi:MAG: NAD(P)-dependent oxidoreductase [Candidatus Electrothrix aestuarii]|uniref:NAD(P)-dependent oxidoreductase n=1 Tax=Candidatus Electrothrix aestuarii TaxID=3062594 RepID=A0AAU8LWZ9_9BACT|nr:NAD(P)-dependent oxidoreductase [Candidatus Electrothrix aestuarii]